MATKKAQKNTAVKEVTTKTSKVATSQSFLLGPRVTEKASMNAERNVFTFNVNPRATAPEIKKEIKQLYKISPLKVRMITIPRKNVFIRGKKGVRGGGKKALVYLKKGDTIELA